MRRYLFILIIGAVGAAPAATVPVFYVPNAGQAPSRVLFVARAASISASFLRREIVLHSPGASVSMRFEGSDRSTRVEGDTPTDGRANFLNGSARGWRRDIPIFAAIRYRHLYPGIDMVYGASGRHLKSEFTVAPGADPARIRIRYGGAGRPRVEADGALSIPTGRQRLGEGAPFVYQERDGHRMPVDARYRLWPDGSVGFELGVYDTSWTLVIDPILSYGTLLGGTGFDAATAIAVDSAGSAYIAGYTDSTNLLTSNPEQNFNAGGNEAFIAKLNPKGNGLLYCTYIGGTGDDRAYGIALDSTGAAFVAGTTTSHDFPTRSPIQSSVAGGRSAFVLKLNPAGNTLVFSTYLGGNGADTAYGITLDPSGNSYVVGDTTSMDFPASGYQTSYKGSQDAFVTKISADGTRILYSTYLGGAGCDHGAGIAVDSTGSAYVTGSTYSLDFPVVNPFQRTNSGWSDAFIARLSSNGNSLIYSTYLGGNSGWASYPEGGQAIALDSQGNAFVAGVTSSSDFTVSHAIQPVLLGSTDAFVAKVNSSGALLFCTYLGGSGVDVANAVAVDASGAVYVAGYTYSTDFPVTTGSQGNIGGDCDAFLIKLSPAGDCLLFATYLGGSGSDTASGVAIDTNGDLYLSGWTLSPNFPVQAGS